MRGIPRPSARPFLAPLLAFALAVGLLPQGQAAAAQHPLAVSDDGQGAAPQVETRSFESTALHRAMRYQIYLPPGYGGGARRYPVLYMLHGMGGSDAEWREYGLLDAAQRMIARREIEPFIIVMPQGDRSYWMDHAGGDRETWGTYTARDVVADVESRFRAVPERAQRAIGGVSMGAHGALQLALNHPRTFGVVGGHSLVLRPFDQAPPFFGGPADFAQRDPMTIIASRPDLARSLALWIDIGDRDPWAPRAAQFDTELAGLGVAHEWHEWPGDHSAAYWRAHVADYLRFYDRAFRSAGARAAVGGEARLVP